MSGEGVLSGRMPDTIGGPFSTLETTEAVQLKQTIETGRNPLDSAMTNFFIGSPSEKI